MVELLNGPTDFRSTTIKPYYEAAPKNPVNTETPNPEIGATPEPVNKPEKQKENPKDDPETAQNLPRRNPERTRRTPERFRCNVADISIFLQGYVNTPEQTSDTTPKPKFEESRQKEIDGLLEKGVFELVNLSDVPKGLRIFNSRFVDKIKHPGTDQAYEKSRLVVQAYNDRGKDLILMQSPTIQHVSQRIILTLTLALQNCPLNPLSLYLQDITQSYVQS